MSRVMFISDLHLGHANVLRWSREWREGEDIDQHDEILISKMASSLTKRDVLYVLGDVTMNNKGSISLLDRVPCKKFLVRGNHDTCPIFDYLSVFDDVFGVVKYKKHWLSHAPIHPAELRGCGNIHGHVHSNSIMSGQDYDRRYVNVCVEALNGIPISYQDILSGRYWDIKRT